MRCSAVVHLQPVGLMPFYVRAENAVGVCRDLLGDMVQHDVRATFVPFTPRLCGHPPSCSAQLPNEELWLCPACTAEVTARQVIGWSLSDAAWCVA